jgi:NAD(P)-dependent dehydrogenase (short-subunit alcohol dehydrogenase family)
MTLIDKVALVTGGARRLGREIALALAREGCDVVLHYRDSRAEADALAREIRSLGRQSWCVCGDFSNVYEPAVTMKTAWDLAGWVDILVNNASSYSHDSLANVPVERMQELWRVNALAPMLLSRAMAELAAGSGILPAGYCGRIVNVLDRSVAKTAAEFSAYWLSKKGLEAFTAAAALEFAPRFSVNAVAPGPVLPPDDADLAEPAGPAPLAIRPLPADVAAAVVYLAGATTVTGQTIYVDSGQHLL